MQIQAEQLARRRQELITRCRQQRESLGLQSGRWATTMSTMDAALVLVQRIREHPGWIVGAVVGLIVVIRPQRLSAVLRASSAALRTWRTVAPVVRLLQRYR